ncbi:MAG TPA: hypothetical protein V6C97_20675 [Oculatellaceae cyanobacterium]
MATKGRTHIAHQIPGRMRLKLPRELSEKERSELLQDLKLSPEVRAATIRGTFLIIEHHESGEALSALGERLNRLFPDFIHWSNVVDSEIAKAVADPWINKTLPLFFLGLAGYTAIAEGAVLAGESAFALAYVAFDIYWKFQQENVIRKIETGLSQKQKEELERMDN